MSDTSKFKGADLLGASRLAIEAVKGVTELAQAVHMNVLERAIGTPLVQPIVGITNFVYSSVKGVTGVVGSGLEAALGKLAPDLNGPDWEGRPAVLAALNGVLGDQLAASANPLAIPMQLKPRGAAGPHILVLVHGLCMNDAQWLRNGHDHGAALAQAHGLSCVYAHYNTGRHISVNGAEFAQQLEALVSNWPVPVASLNIIGHSMGGLVARSACLAAAQHKLSWPARLRKMIFLGSPHMGAPLERGGNWITMLADLNAYSAPFARLAKLRSAGITDLRHASLRDADWFGADRFADNAAPAMPPLPQGVDCYAIAGTIGETSTDGLVPVDSALGRPSLAWTGSAVLAHTNHMDLLDSAEAAALLSAYIRE